MAKNTSAPTMDIGIPEKDRARIAEGLSRLLADSFTLYLTTHKFHWNVKGPMFQTLHVMFETQYPEAKAMVRILVQGQEAVARTARKIFPVVDKASDEPTADLLTQRMQVHEKTAWMLRSLLEA